MENVIDKFFEKASFECIMGILRNELNISLKYLFTCFFSFFFSFEL